MPASSLVFFPMALALVAMSAGAWGARRSPVLKLWHVVAVWVAFILACGSAALCPFTFEGLTLHMLMVGAFVGLSLIAGTAVLGIRALRSDTPELKVLFPSLAIRTWLLLLPPVIVGGLKLVG